MKETLKNAVAEIERDLGELEGIIVIACDKENQYSLLDGKCYKMLTELAGTNAQMLALFDDAVKGVKMDKVVQHFFETPTAME